MTKKIKLIKKTSNTFLITGLVLIVLSSIVLYFYTRYLLQNQVEEELISTEARVVHALENHEVHYSLPPVAEVRKIDLLASQVLKDTVIYDPSQDEMELFRDLSTFRNINGKIIR